MELDGINLAPADQVGSDQGASPSEPLPTAVIIHGGPADRDLNRLDPSGLYWAPYLLAKGYAVLMPQYRGSYGQGSHFASYSRTGHGRENYDDIITITNHAIRKGFADEKRLLASGWSMGGLLVYLCSVRMASTSSVGALMRPCLVGPYAIWTALLSPLTLA